MSIRIVNKASKEALPIYLVSQETLPLAAINPDHLAWVRETGYFGEKSSLLLLPGEGGRLEGALFGNSNRTDTMLELGDLAKYLPAGEWYLADSLADGTLAALGFLLGGYKFNHYKQHEGRAVHLVLPDGADDEYIKRTTESVFLVRDLINMPGGDLGPEELEKSIRKLASECNAEVSCIKGDDLLINNLGMIHAVGRASNQAPRLIDLRWGNSGAPMISLVGKGVCFDTGGLDIKSANNMFSMKKDMGGAANILGLARMIMKNRLNLRLRVLIPTVENSIAGNAFRPGDVLRSHKGLTVEVGDTDAEGRLILADALSLADEESPCLLLDMATLTGAARVALGPDLPAFFTEDEILATEICEASRAVKDPLWRMPLWSPYEKKLKSEIASLRNVTFNSHAGAITATLFLRKFVERAKAWAHFDVFAWNDEERPWGPKGGEAQCIRALERFLIKRYG